MGVTSPTKKSPSSTSKVGRLPSITPKTNKVTASKSSSPPASKLNTNSSNSYKYTKNSVAIPRFSPNTSASAPLAVDSQRQSYSASSSSSGKHIPKHINRTEAKTTTGSEPGNAATGKVDVKSHRLSFEDFGHTKTSQVNDNDDDGFHEVTIEVLKTHVQPDPFNPCWICRERITLRTWCRIIGCIEAALFVGGILLEMDFGPQSLHYNLKFTKKEDRLLATILFVVSVVAFLTSSICLLVAAFFNYSLFCKVNVLLMALMVTSGVSYLAISAPNQNNSLPVNVACVVYTVVNFYAGLCAFGLYCQLKSGLYDQKIQMDPNYIAFMADDEDDLDLN